MSDIRKHHAVVEHRTDADGETVDTYLKFECRGDRDSTCHIYPDCDCESYDEEHEKEHPSVPHDDCVVLPWLDECCGETCFTGADGDPVDFPGEIPAGSGPISVVWDECLSWSWAAEVSA